MANLHELNYPNTEVTKSQTQIHYGIYVSKQIDAREMSNLYSFLSQYNSIVKIQFNSINILSSNVIIRGYL